MTKIGPLDLSQLKDRIFRPTADWQMVFVEGVGVDAPSYADKVVSDGNLGPGGWSWVTLDGRSDSGSDPHSTNGRMALIAVREAMSNVAGDLLFVSDNAYLNTCFDEGWWHVWRSYEWKNQDGDPFENQDLWKPIIDEYREMNIEFVSAVNHPDSPDIDIAAQLASAAEFATAKKLAQQAQAQAQEQAQAA